MNRKKILAKKIALERIRELLENAKKFPQYENYYIQMIKKIKSAHKIKLDYSIKTQFCKYCNAFHRNPKIRIVNKTCRIICSKCGRKTEIVFK